MWPVLRLPTNATERAIPVGVVSNSYALVQHDTVIDRCLAAIAASGIDPEEVQCEIGLSDLGEWVNFRAVLPKQFGLLPKDGHRLQLRVEAFNSVEGSGRLVVLLSWFRLVCPNGAVVKDTIMAMNDTHNPFINLVRIDEAISQGLARAKEDQRLLRDWEKLTVTTELSSKWVDGFLSERWGKKAACRVYHICQSGHDVDLVSPFEPGPATRKTVKVLLSVPGRRSQRPISMMSGYGGP
jgi:Domain of unknown function (DUF932)